jgi:hypothetical protein
VIRLFTFLLGVLLVSPLEAASIRFLPLNDEVAARKIGVRDPKGATKPLSLDARKRSAAFTHPTGGKPLVLVAEDKDGATLELPLVAELKAPLVVIFPDATHASGLRGIVVEDDSAGFPWGSLRMINVTDIPLVVRCEKKDTPVPVAATPVDLVPGGDARNMSVQLAKEGSPETVLYSAVWEHDPNVRKLIFFLPGENPEDMPVELKIVPDDKRVKK